jgi:hypothetical protein
MRVTRRFFWGKSMKGITPFPAQSRLLPRAPCARRSRMRMHLELVHDQVTSSIPLVRSRPHSELGSASSLPWVIRMLAVGVAGRILGLLGDGRRRGRALRLGNVCRICSSNKQTPQDSFFFRALTFADRSFENGYSHPSVRIASLMTGLHSSRLAFTRGPPRRARSGSPFFSFTSAILHDCIKRCRIVTNQLRAVYRGAPSARRWLINCRASIALR